MAGSSCEREQSTRNTYEGTIAGIGLSERKKDCLTGKIDGFIELATLFERLEKSGRVSFD